MHTKYLASIDFEMYEEVVVLEGLVLHDRPVNKTALTRAAMDGVRRTTEKLLEYSTCPTQNNVSSDRQLIPFYRHYMHLLLLSNPTLQDQQRNINDHS